MEIADRSFVWKGPSPLAPLPTSLQLHTPSENSSPRSLGAALCGPTSSPWAQVAFRERTEVHHYGEARAPSLGPGEIRAFLEIRTVPPLWARERRGGEGTAMETCTQQSTGLAHPEGPWGKTLLPRAQWGCRELCSSLYEPTIVLWLSEPSPGYRLLSGSLSPSTCLLRPFACLIPSVP